MSFLVTYIVVAIYLTFLSCVNRMNTFHVLSSRCLSLNIVALNVAIALSAKTLLKQKSVTCRLKMLLVECDSSTSFFTVCRKRLSYNKKRGKSFQISLFSMSGKRGSNSWPSAWEADALPTELLPQVKSIHSIKMRCKITKYFWYMQEIRHLSNQSNLNCV